MNSGPGHLSLVIPGTRTSFKFKIRSALEQTQSTCLRDDVESASLDEPAGPQHPEMAFAFRACVQSGTYSPRRCRVWVPGAGERLRASDANLTGEMGLSLSSLSFPWCDIYT